MPLHPKIDHLLSHLNLDWLYLSGTGLHRLSWKTGSKTGVVAAAVVVEAVEVLRSKD